MKILFIGTVQFSLESLKKLIEMNADIVGVCTKEKSSFNSDFVNLAPICIEHNIPYKYVDDINSKNNIDWISGLSPDIIFCFGWSSLIKKELLTLSPMGVIGYHPAQLPYNRGRHPLIWALVLGLTQSASTFFFMDEGADSGDILSQRNFDVLYTDDAHSLYKKVTEIAISQIEEFVPQLTSNQYTRIKQNHTISNTWRKRNRLDGIIDFRMNSNTIYNLVRALSKPYVGASIVYDNKDTKVWKVEEVVYNMKNIEYGKILEVKHNTILVKTADNAIRIIEHEFSVLPKVGEYL